MSEIDKSRDRIAGNIALSIFSAYWFQSFPTHQYYHHYQCRSCGNGTDIYLITDSEDIEPVCVNCSSMLVESVKLNLCRLLSDYFKRNHDYNTYNTYYTDGKRVW